MAQHRTRIALLVMFALLAVSLGASSMVSAATKPNSNQRIKDVYVFTSQEDSERVVLAMTLDVAATMGQRPTFDTQSLYEFKIDTNGDGVEDKVVQTTFAGTGEHQQVTLHGPAVPELTGGHGRVINGPMLSGDISLASSPTILARTGYMVRAFAGLRDDPAVGAEAKGKNVLAIVVEVPKSALIAEGKTAVDVWATVSSAGDGR